MTMQSTPPGQALMAMTLMAMAILAVAALTGCAAPALTSAADPSADSASPALSLRPFSTDGCSLYPDRDERTGQDWCSCCVAHDRAYWRGGTEDERWRADEALRACVEAKTGDASRAALMFRGVRLGGSAHWPTSFRWGYGWPFGRYYQPLTPSEAAAADRLEATYAAEVGFDHCPSAPRAAVAPSTAASAPASNPLPAPAHDSR